MKKGLNDTFFQEVIQGMQKNKHVHGAILCVESGDSSVSWVGATGDRKPEDRVLIASVTKLYVTAVLLMLRDQGRLSFGDPMHTYFPGGLLDGLHVLGGTDYTREITIAHLLSNTSGIPDYFYYGKTKGESAMDRIRADDPAWPLEKAIGSAKAREPKFPPGQKGRVQYSDTNYQLLGAIIEAVSGKWIGDVFGEFLFEPLGLQDTYAFRKRKDMTPAPFYFKDQPVRAPRYIASVTAEGGIVSTARETMVFLKAFFGGRFFPVETIGELTAQWNLILFPGQFFFGLGLEKLWTPRFLSPLAPVGDMLGFWGQTGAFAFHNPQKDLYFTGTVNQASGLGHGAAHKAMLKVVRSA